MADDDILEIETGPDGEALDEETEIRVGLREHMGELIPRADEITPEYIANLIENDEYLNIQTEMSELGWALFQRLRSFYYMMRKKDTTSPSVAELVNWCPGLVEENVVLEEVHELFAMIQSGKVYTKEGMFNASVLRNAILLEKYAPLVKKLIGLQRDSIQIRANATIKRLADDFGREAARNESKISTDKIPQLVKQLTSVMKDMSGLEEWKPRAEKKETGEEMTDDIKMLIKMNPHLQANLLAELKEKDENGSPPARG